MDIIKTLEDINNKLIHAKTDIQRHKLQYTYDNLVDRYIFHIDIDNRNTKRVRENNFNMLTANQIELIHRKEIAQDYNGLVKIEASKNIHKKATQDFKD